MLCFLSSQQIFSYQLAPITKQCVNKAHKICVSKGGIQMPLLRFDLIEGRDQKALQALLDTAHQAMVEAFGMPESDRYQIVHQHPENELVIHDTGLGFHRSKDLIVISITSKTRTKSQKEKLYALLAEKLEAECGISPEDLMVSITENGDADWSFGLGEAQFLNGKL
jgi:phenylpyruvate tautomerase PptA (4-oxalocrotonate tautomerase family)